MSSSSNISMRQRFMKVTRKSDGVTVLVNLNLVRTAEPIVGGVKLSFGNAASDNIEISGANIETIRNLLEP